MEQVVQSQKSWGKKVNMHTGNHRCSREFVLGGIPGFLGDNCSHCPLGMIMLGGKPGSNVAYRLAH